MTMHLDDFYIAHQQHDHPIYAATPKTMTTLVSASSTAPASWRTIPTGAMAEYVAHRDIILQPGFSAEAGCEFTARIEPCLLCDREMTLIENESVVEELGGTTDRVRMGNHTDSTTTTKSGIILFPNPTDNVINILTDKDIVMVSVFDMTGKNVTGWKKFTEQCGTFSISQMTKASLLVLAWRENVVAKKPTVSIDVSNLSIGTYTLLVKTINGDLQAARFIKK